MKDNDRAWLGEDLHHWRESIRSGYTRAYIYQAFYELGVFEAIRRAGPNGLTANEIAAERGLDPYLLEGVLDFTAFADTVLQKVGDRYSLGETGDWLFDGTLAQSLMTVVGAYGPLLTELEPALKREKRYGVDFVRRGDKLAIASGGATRESYPWIASELKNRGIGVLADLGCGAAEVLIEFCRLDSSLRGVGIDISPGALAVAGAKVKEAGLHDRIRLVQGDLTRPESYSASLKDVGAFTCIGVLHEFLKDGEDVAISMLQRMKTEFPGAFMFVGELDVPTLEQFGDMPIPDRIRKLFFQHVQHVLSLQGLPMKRERWLRLYERAGVEVVTVKDYYLDQHLLKF